MVSILILLYISLRLDNSFESIFVRISVKGFLDVKKEKEKIDFINTRIGKMFVYEDKRFQIENLELSLLALQEA